MPLCCSGRLSLHGFEGVLAAVKNMDFFSRRHSLPGEGVTLVFKCLSDVVPQPYAGKNLNFMVPFLRM